MTSFTGIEECENTNTTTLFFYSAFKQTIIIFQAIAIETSCVFGRDTNVFISRLGHLTTSISGERREAEFLRQRLSLATVRGNAQSVTQAGRPSS